MILIEGGLPRPDVQVSLGSLQGDFIARVDMLYEEGGVVIEYDGTNHRDRLVEDNRRQNRLLRAGYLVLRYTASDVHHRPNAIVSEVRGAVQLPVSRKRATRDAPGGSFRKDF
jgi:very-short-patch-repair endonuclease